jgi:FkbM family methyltransferase
MVILRNVRSELGLLNLKTSCWFRRPGSSVHCAGFNVCINDARNFYILYKDIFVRRIYHFRATRSDPLVLDCGSNIGLSIFYFKHVYPEARIVGFEPDEQIFPYLERNVARNKLHGVRLVQAALSSTEGRSEFFSDGKYGGGLAENLMSNRAQDWVRSKVRSVRLREYLHDPVDFLKMNIEGAEYDVLKDSEDLLRQINEMIIEYHHLPGLPRTLHSILQILDRQGFEYLINDFDSQTNGSVKPPFNLTPESRYFLLIYAKRLA